MSLDLAALRARHDDEGAWRAEGDTLGPVGKDDSREVAIVGGYPVEREIVQ